jgi:hypothetical protein
MEQFTIKLNTHNFFVEDAMLFCVNNKKQLACIFSLHIRIGAAKKLF